MELVRTASQEAQHQEYLTLKEAMMLEIVENYGEMLDEVAFDTIVYKGTTPGLSYEEFMYDIPVPDSVNIGLTASTLDDRIKGIFQLSHECVHLLSPLSYNDNPITNNLEEGVAVYFSKKYTLEKTGDENHFNSPSEFTGYKYAYELVVKLFSEFPDAVKRIRVYQAHFTKITEADFEKAGINVDKELIIALLADFLDILPVASPDENTPDVIAK